MELSYKVKKSFISVIGGLITGSLFIGVLSIFVVFVGSLSYGIYKIIEIF